MSLTNGNVIAKAKIAKESSDWVNIRQMVEMEKGNAMFPGATFDNTKTQVPSAYTNDIQITTGGTILLKYNATTKISDLPNAVEKLGAIYIPNGFTYSEGEKETGLVIKDVSAGITDNEYVWVPVEGTLKTEAFMTDEWFTNNWGDSFGNLFADDIASAGYTPMKTSVEKYNGFYVSRYEAGADTISTGSNLAMGGIALKPLSQKNKYVWNNIPWDSSGNYLGDDTQTGAALVSKNAYKDNTAVASSLLYGAQYDAMLNYINTTSTSVTNSTTWGNHYDSSITVSAGAKKSTDNGSSYTNISTATTKPVNTAWLLTTGASEQSKAKNIYDVAGNVWEWTYEVYTAYNLRVIRSGSFDYSGADYPAAYRDGFYPDSSVSVCGFRFALYIK